MPSSSLLHDQLDALWRIESPRIIAPLVRLTRDLGLAEEAAQEALAAALQSWPEAGTPDNPAAWLAATARRRAIDRIRRDRAERRALEAAALTPRADPDAALDEADTRLDGAPEDDVLRLIFMA
ncbi:MAG TPA: sigma factor, partial [Phycisphaerales bacterium]|nr:sigma factor [Phycisphaerales bacterium]